MAAEDRTSNVEFEDCPECAFERGSGICANCERDGKRCTECRNSGKCKFCEGTGRSRIETDPEVKSEVEAAGPLIVPPGEESDS